MKKILFLILYMMISTSPVYAYAPEAGSAATLSSNVSLSDTRVDVLKMYLSKYNPEMEQYAAVFIREADTYGLDWKFVAAISGVESTFCRHIPYGSYNCWGWGIPTGAKSGIGFSDYSDGIQTVSEGLRKNYIDDGLLTVEQIGRRYAASPTWASHVRYFMNQIDASELSMRKTPSLTI